MYVNIIFCSLMLFYFAIGKDHLSTVRAAMQREGDFYSVILFSKP